MPLSNAERQKIFRQRKRNVTVGMITDSNGKPNSSVQRVAEGLLRGLSNHQALIQAGSSPSADILITKAKEGLAQVLKAKALTIERLVESTTGLLEATSPMLTAEGCIEKPAWEARDKGIRHGIALLDRAGELPSAQATQGGTQITVNIVRFDAPQDMVDVTPDKACEDVSS